MNNVSYDNIARKYRDFKNALYMNEGYEFCKNLSDEELGLLTEVMLKKLDEEKREPFTVERQYIRIIQQVLEERKDSVSLAGKVA